MTSASGREAGAVVVVVYRERHIDRTLTTLSSVLRGLPARWVVVSNAPAIGDARIIRAAGSSGVRATIVRHDNGGLEFGGYQAGLNALVGEMPPWTLFANDSFASHRPFTSVTRETLRAWLARTAAPHAEIVGQVESLPRSFALCGLRTHRWITTNLFALNRLALAALDRRIHDPQLNELVSGSDCASAFFSPAIDAALREHLEAWLFGSKPGPRWYGAAALSGENATAMAAKARSILQEKWLSARLEAVAAEFVDLKKQPFVRLLRHKLEERAFRWRTGIG